MPQAQGLSASGSRRPEGGSGAQRRLREVLGPPPLPGRPASSPGGLGRALWGSGSAPGNLPISKIQWETPREEAGATPLAPGYKDWLQQMPREGLGRCFLGEMIDFTASHPFSKVPEGQPGMSEEKRS